MKNKIIEFIRKHKLSTSVVADALDRTGFIVGLFPINRGHHVAGEVTFLYACNGSNWPTHRDLAHVDPDRILYVLDYNCGGKALMGSLMSKYAVEYKKAAGVVIGGPVRDVGEIMEANWPIWAAGTSPIICDKTPAEDKEKFEWYRDKYDGCGMVCDDCGCVMIERHRWTEEFYDRLNHTLEQEKVWFDYLERGYSTFEITCEKVYLKDA